MKPSRSFGHQDRPQQSSYCGGDPFIRDLPIFFCYFCMGGYTYSTRADCGSVPVVAEPARSRTGDRRDAGRFGSHFCLCTFAQRVPRQEPFRLRHHAASGAIPPTVAGYFLLVLLSRHSPLGALYEKVTGGPLVFTWQAAVVAAFVHSSATLCEGGPCGGFVTTWTIALNGLRRSLKASELRTAST